MLNFVFLAGLLVFAISSVYFMECLEAQSTPKKSIPVFGHFLGILPRISGKKRNRLIGDKPLKKASLNIP